MAGKKYGKWTVMKFIRDEMWLCVCECGGVKKVNGYLLRSGKTSKCRDCYTKELSISAREKRIDLTGKKFNSWTVLSHTHSGIYVCECKCGAKSNIPQTVLTQGKSKSCKDCVESSLPKYQWAINTILTSYKTAARKRNYVWELEKKEFESFLLGDCFYCGKKTTDVPCCIKTTGKGLKKTHFYYNGIDRIDNTKGYSMDNAVSCCSVCNRAKHSMPTDIFYIWLNRIKYNNGK